MLSNFQDTLRIVDTLFDPDGGEKIICYRQMRGQSAPLYKVWLSLEGPSMPFVNQVTYTLHPTFPDPERRVARTVSNPNCQMVIWAWGVFTVQAVVEDKQGRLIRLEHYLTFNQQITDAKREGSGVRFEVSKYNS